MKKNKKDNWGSIAWKCKKCDVQIVQDVLKKCPFCGTEKLKKVNREISN